MRKIRLGGRHRPIVHHTDRRIAHLIDHRRGIGGVGAGSAGGIVAAAIAAGVGVNRRRTT
jgi:hypothetical protein